MSIGRALILLAAAAAVAFALLHTNAPSPAHTLERAAQYYEYAPPRLFADEYFLLNTLAAGDARFRTPKILALLHNNRPITEPMRALFSGYTIATEEAAHYIDAATLWSDAALIHSLYCTQFSYDESDVAHILTYRDNNAGYADVHVLFALLLARTQGCAPGAMRDSAIDDLATTLARAEYTTGSPDLNAERIVMLYWAGKGSLVKKQWIDTLRTQQQLNGGWEGTDSATGVRTTNLHSTGFAALAILYVEQGKDTQEFFKLPEY